MPPFDLLQALRRRPFVPFRLHVVDGTVYDIRHPHGLMVSTDSVVIGIPASPEKRFFKTTALVDLMHVVRLEFLPEEPR